MRGMRFFLMVSQLRRADNMEIPPIDSREAKDVELFEKLRIDAEKNGKKDAGL